MKEKQILFVCSNCGEEFLKWQGKCPNCGLWNTLKEYKVSGLNRNKTNKTAVNILELDKVKTSHFERISTGLEEFDRVLGGGIVPGSITILGGDPGIGKSTLLLQLASSISNMLYISGEESAEQLKLRFDRLGLKAKGTKLCSDVDVDSISDAIEKNRPNLVVVDSIQTVYSSQYPSTPGSIVQVRESALRLQQLSKTTMIPIILVGHVTKEGTVAGPKTLEHLVDVVLYLEGDRFQNHRILQTAKNRFGALDEIGIFEMTQKGMAEVKNPSELFMASETLNVPGTTISATCEGSRSILIEIQALTSTAVYGYPQRRATGFDINRLQMIIAVLQRRGDINLSNQDVFINVVGGYKIKEPAVDLAVALALASAAKNKKIQEKLCVFGEIGLSGEIRKVNLENKRQSEAKRLGFSKFITAKTLIEAVRRYCV